MPRTKRTARVSVGGTCPRKALACKASQRRDRGPPCPDPSFDETAVSVRRPPRTETTGAPPAPLADASADALQSSAAAAQLFETAAAAARLIKTAKDEQQTMANRWDSAVADTHKPLDGKPVVPAVKSESHSDGTTTSSAEADPSKPRS
ncbi:hypothetical protein K525DRAFT_275547 [Schizophyllum commune Loenen D]|nr:hypothetical protein K525DRAFT_275547 [Schizophyllum commune Loenen D]